MRAFWFTCLCLALAGTANAELLMYENFNYAYDLGADPNSDRIAGKVNANGKVWYKPTAGQPTATADTHRLVPNSYTSVGDAVTPGGHLQVPNAPQLNISKTAIPLIAGMADNQYTSAEPSLFYSFYLRLNNYTTVASPSYETIVAGFHVAGDGTAGTGSGNGGMTLNGSTQVAYAGTLRLRSSDADPLKFEIGLSKTAHFTPNLGNDMIKWAPGAYSPLETLQIVVEYDLNSGTNDDVSRLWINPAPGVLTTAPTVEITAADNFTDTSAGIRSFYFRSDTRTPGTLHFDDLRIGTTFQSVLPEPGSLALAVLGVVALGIGRRRKG